MAAKDLRAKLLKFTPKRTRLVKVDIPVPEGAEPESVEVLVQQPSLEERDLILAETNAEGKLEKGKLGRMQVTAVMLCCRDPLTNERIWEDTDMAVLLSLPSGGYVDQLSAMVMQLMAEGGEAAKATFPGQKE